MKKRILKHLNDMEEYLESLSDRTEEELTEMLARHMTEIQFFMHERLIHLIVTVLFALGTFMTIFTYLLTDNIGLIALGVLLIVLLAPYIKHYYLLENGVQKMYIQYDKLYEECMKRKKDNRLADRHLNP